MQCQNDNLLIKLTKKGKSRNTGNNILNIVFMCEMSRAKEAVANFENTNGTKVKNVTVKELVLILHNEQTENHKGLTKKIDKHIEWGQKEDKIITKALADHDILFREITNKLPEIGFCERVKATLWPATPEFPLAYKVNRLWNLSRLARYILIGLFALGIGNIIVEVI